MNSKKILFTLTVLLIVVGVLMLVVNWGNDEEISFDDSRAFDAARAEDRLPADVPALPVCARAILIVSSEGATDEISFTCSDKWERDAYIAQVKQGFLWNVLFFEPDRITLKRAAAE